MATLATLIVKLLGDTTDFQAAMDKAGKTVSETGKKMTAVGKGLTMGVTLPLVGLGVVAVNAASNLDESMNKVKVVFGDSAEAVVDFSSTAAVNLGMSQQAALEAAGTFGNLFTSMGMGVEPAADMSTGLVQLASDLASFNNLDPAEALEKLRSGLVGETEPLRALGVNLTAAAVKAKALEMGLAGATGKLTPAALAQARYALILEQTKNAQGDFARTSDGFANSMRTLKAQFVDAAAGIGTLLLPYVTQLVGWIQQGIGWFQGLNPEMQKWVVIIGVVAAALGPAIMIIGSLVSALGTILPIVGAVAGVLTFPLIAIIAAVIAVVALLAAAWKNNWGDIQGKTATVVAWIKTTVQNFLAALQAFWDAHGAQIIATVTAIWDVIVAVFKRVFDILKTLFAVWQAAFSGDWRKFGELLRELWEKAWKLMVDLLKGYFTLIVKAFNDLWPKIKTWFTSMDWGALGKAMIEGIGAGITKAAGILKDIIKKVIDAAIKAAKGLLGIQSPSKVFMEMGKNVMLGMAEGIGDWGDLPEVKVTKTVRGMVEGGYGAERRNQDRGGMMVFGGINLYGVESGKGLLEEIQGMSV